MIKMLNKHSCLECCEINEHNKEIMKAMDKLLSVRDFNCALICKYQDPIHSSIPQSIESCNLSDIINFLNTRDIKNGVDLLHDSNFLIFVLYGQSYSLKSDNKIYYVEEAIKVMPYNESRDFINIIPILNNKAPEIITSLS